jgi:predicted site-specific integrase-resolvase
MPNQEQSKVEPVFDTHSAAPLLGVKPGTLEVWRCQGRGPRFVKSGSRVVYRLRDINEYLDSRTRKSTADPGPAGE